MHSTVGLRYYRLMWLDAGAVAAPLGAGCASDSWQPAVPRLASTRRTHMGHCSSVTCVLALRLRAGALAAPLGAAALWAAASLHRSAGAAASAKAAPDPGLAAAYLRLIDVLARVSCAGEPAAEKGDTLTLIQWLCWWLSGFSVQRAGC